MIKIIILNKLRDEIIKTFKKDCDKVFSLIATLKENPNKGKSIGIIGSLNIKELKYKTFRFYYVLDKYNLILFNQNKINELLIRFIEMSKKNDQQKTIERIKYMLEQIKE